MKPLLPMLLLLVGSGCHQVDVYETRRVCGLEKDETVVMYLHGRAPVEGTTLVPSIERDCVQKMAQDLRFDWSSFGSRPKTLDHIVIDQGHPEWMWIAGLFFALSADFGTVRDLVEYDGKGPQWIHHKFARIAEQIGADPDDPGSLLVYSFIAENLGPTSAREDLQVSGSDAWAARLPSGRLLVRADDVPNLISDAFMTLIHEASHTYRWGHIRCPEGTERVGLREGCDPDANGAIGASIHVMALWVNQLPKPPENWQNIDKNDIRRQTVEQCQLATHSIGLECQQIVDISSLNICKLFASGEGPPEIEDAKDPCL